MDKIWQTISGLVFAAVMTISMANRTYAENDETILPETPPAAIAESANETTASMQETVSEGEEVSSEEKTASEDTEDAAAKGEDKDPLEEESADPEDESVSSEEESALSEQEYDENTGAEAESVREEKTSEGEMYPAEIETVSSEEELVSAEEISLSFEQEEEKNTGAEAESIGEEDVSEEDMSSTEEKTVSAEEELVSAEEGSSSFEQEDEHTDAETESAGEEALTEEITSAEEETVSDEEGFVSAETAEAADSDTEETPEEKPVFLRSALSVNVPESTEMPNEPAVTAEESTGGSTTAAAAVEQSAEEEEDPAESVPNELILVGENGIQEVLSETDLVIKTAGVQHISNLTSDGDVYVIGTGILLVDNVDLLEGCGIFLQSLEEIYGKDGGTAALFVLTGEQDGMKTYTLFNGTNSDGSAVLPAVLDEEYVVPAGINLVIPDGGSIVMQSILTLVETQGDRTVAQYSFDGYPEPVLSGEDVILEQISTAPTLTISQSAGMTIEKGADFRMVETKGIPMLDTNWPLLIVQGLLTLNEDVEKGRIVIEETGNVEGSGFFVNSHELAVEEGGAEAVTCLNVDNAWIFVNGEGRDIGRLTTRGRTDIRYESDISIGTVLVDSGMLTVTNTYIGKENTLTVCESVTGNDGSVLKIESGSLLLPDSGACTIPVVEEYEFSRGGRWETWNYLGHASAGGSTLRYQEGALRPAPLIPLGEESASENEGILSIPVGEGELRQHSHIQFHGEFSEYRDITRAEDEAGEPVFFICAADDKISYADLAFALGEDAPATEELEASKYHYFAVTCVNGTYGYKLFKPDGTETADAKDVALLFRMRIDGISDPMGGNSTTATNTSFTGTGVLGGNGAGSVSGGTKCLAVTGTRRSSETSEEDDSEPDTENTAGFHAWTEKLHQRGCFELHLEIAGKAVSRLMAPVKIRMAYTFAEESESKPLYAVFRDTDGSLKAFEAHYDAAAGILSFSSDIAGRFVVVAFDFTGEPFSEEFYQALAKLDTVKTLFA